jgi:hypothetical protein
MLFSIAFLCGLSFKYPIFYLGIIVWLYSVFDAYNIAKKANTKDDQL